MSDTILNAFDQPDETREFAFSRFEIVRLSEVSLSRATYQPGWKWSVHNAPSVGTALYHVPYTVVVLSGCAVGAYEDGRVIDLLPWQAFQISSVPHDSWVVGEQPYISLHVLNVRAH